MKPKRVQRSRKAGASMGDAVYVGRPTMWGNPWRVVCISGRWWVIDDRDQSYAGAFETKRQAAAYAVDYYRNRMDNDPVLRAAARAKLAGHDLACWCGLDMPCHVDVLLEIANAEQAEGGAG